ncbi:hypothetical protein V6N11_077147 [Hibiscus sabdariffa]|uniref:Uncharacterized protein n=1 Tax=Hibiscus sabdariffa TaxID=183260 RepID=A0ABR2TC82_9ROSI
MSICCGMSDCRDLQSYLSDLSIFIALESNKFYILVDNQPWLRDLGSRPALLWQLMVTKSRLSPFAIINGRRDTKEGKEDSSGSNAEVSNKFERWMSSIHDKIFSRKNKLETSLLLCSELNRTLYGFIVFEVAWSNVRGINYYNELQTDTSLAIEAKFMQRWEFDSIDQAASCISSWFSGTDSEQHCLKEHLESIIGEVFYDVEEDFPMPITYDGDYDDGFSIEDSLLHDHCDSFEIYSGTMDSDIFEPHASAPIGLYNRRKVTRTIITGAEVDAYCEETRREAENSLDNSSETEVEASEYRDVLILFRFDDRDLPFKLKEIITPDLRLLRLLEAGLPAWALFLQSYPGFCHIYRPWMCPLARALYVLISIITVLIGFFDLYKNVPLLKITASHLCGPLLDWIENWEMVTRIKYLGTMLFLQNFEKAMLWLWVVFRAIRSFFSFLNLPLAGPLMELLEFLFPIWRVLSEFSVTLVGHEIFEVPLIQYVSFAHSSYIHATAANSVLYPMFCILWEILYSPIRLVLALASFVANVCAFIFDVVGDICQALSSMIEIASEAEATVSSTQEVSMWQSLWSDLLSQIFRALRSILYGFAAFFDACNRHRLRLLFKDQLLSSPDHESRIGDISNQQVEISIRSEPETEVNRVLQHCDFEFERCKDFLSCIIKLSGAVGYGITTFRLPRENMERIG